LNFLRFLGRNLTTLLTAFLLALAVWVLAVISTDPSQTQPLQKPVPITILGQDPALMVTNSLPEETIVVLKAPRSVWARINADPASVRAILDLSALQSGQHTVPLQVQVAEHPAAVVSTSIDHADVTLEKIESRTLPVGYLTVGSPAPGYALGSVALTPQSATVSGPASRIASVMGLQTSLQLNNAAKNIDQELTIFPLDNDGNVVTGVQVVPATVQASQAIEQRGGYRTVVVKVPFTGQLANGYRLNSVTVTPPVLTVFSDDPKLVENLPGYIETIPVDLTGIDADREIKARLNLPQGIQMDGEESALVRLGISPLEGSLTFSNQMVEIEGLDAGLSAKVSPTRVDVIISGPLPLLNKLTANDVHVMMDLAGMTPGNYQKKPVARISIDGLNVDSILPETLEVIITLAVTPTP
jgi:YbbR domain-containing protein